MAHRVTFEVYGKFQQHLSQAEVKDLIEVLFKGRDSDFIVRGQMKHGQKKGTRGLYNFMQLENVHSICLDLPTISRSVGNAPIGGNFPAPTLRLAIAMVLAHEIQHANQVVDPHSQKQNKIIPFQTYLSRVHEKDARRSVDENIEIIAKVLGEPVPYNVRQTQDVEKDGPDLAAVADDLKGCSELTVADLAEELRSMKANNPKNIEKLKLLLEQKGVRVV